MAVLLVLVAGLMAWPRLMPLGAEGSPSAVPSIPGTPGHFDDGTLSFVYPVDWPVIAGGFSSGGVEYVLAVLGQGEWREGCVQTDSSMTCGSDTFQVAPGGILVKVYRWGGGPAVPCRGDTQANATFGETAVRKTIDGTTTSWEIRAPGNEFGQPNNIFVEAHTSAPTQLTRAEALVASLRWAPGQSGGWNCDSTESPAPTPARYDADGISFDYPTTWRVLFGYQHWVPHGPTIRFAVGTGSVDSGCTVRTSPNPGVACTGPTIAATGDQVVVIWYEGPFLVDPGALPSGSLSPGEARTTVGGMPAIESHGDGWVRWQLSQVGYIEGRWGPDATNAAAEVDALIKSLSVAP
jgi:hypothetical protein